jgi:nitrogen regulatory protein P-II 2
MEKTSLILLTVVAEAILEDHLVRDLRSVGITGHTASPARGQGSRGVRSGAGGEGNVRIEVLARPDVADDALALLAERYFEHYAVVAWLTDVKVLRGDKYT